MDYRIEHDSLGEVKVPKDVYWGAQTQRSIQNFNIGQEKIPVELIKAFGYIKKAATLVNKKHNLIDSIKADAIIQASDELIEEKLNSNFQLSVWQTGSGTQTHMNVNEVLANRASQILKTTIKIHPNDDVNIAQSSNDTFPSATHIAVIFTITQKLLPTIKELENTLKQKEKQYQDIIKIGRTHLQDAVPLSLGQEISAWSEMLHKSYTLIENSLEPLRELALGGTAVGTGLNSYENFDKEVIEKLSTLTKENFIPAPNKFHALTSLDTLVVLHGSLKALATDMMKIANDIRWLASGPRAGLGELFIPANEPGSSIMPGKINPTQSEAVTMVTAQILGNDTTIGFAASQGNFQLNVFQPVVAYNIMQSINLLSDSIDSFNKNCVVGITPNLTKIDQNLHNSLMSATALAPHIGYEKSTKIVQEAFKKGVSLKEAAILLEYVTAKEFEKYINYKDMIKPKKLK